MGSDVENVIETPIAEAMRQHEAGIGGFLRGTSPAMLTFEAVVTEIAPTNIPVLLVGERGTAKQMFAHSIRQLPGRTGPFMKISSSRPRAESFTSELGVHGRHEPEFRLDAGTAFLGEI